MNMDKRNNTKNKQSSQRPTATQSDVKSGLEPGNSTRSEGYKTSAIADSMTQRASFHSGKL